MLEGDERERILLLERGWYHDYLNAGAAVSLFGKGDSYQSLGRYYARMERQMQGLPEPDDPTAPKPMDRNDPRQIARDIERDPWIGVIIRQVYERDRARQLEREKEEGTDTKEGVVRAMERARRERDTLLREAAARDGRIPQRPSGPLYQARRRPDAFGR